MAVMVQDEGVKILEYDVKEGASIEFRVGGTMRAFMQRVGPAPNGEHVSLMPRLATSSPWW